MAVVMVLPTMLLVALAVLVVAVVQTIKRVVLPHQDREIMVVLSC